LLRILYALGFTGKISFKSDAWLAHTSRPLAGTDAGAPMRRRRAWVLCFSARSVSAVLNLDNTLIVWYPWFCG